MAKNVKKNTEKARMNWGWDLPENRDGKASRRTNKQVNKAISKIGFAGIVIALVFMLLGCGVGGGVIYFLSRNDCFVINGREEITLTIGENYVDDGVKVISFGRDLSDSCVVDTDLIINQDGSYTASEIGTYYIKYSVDDIKYSKIFTVEKIRLITFVEETIADEVDMEVDNEE